MDISAEAIEKAYVALGIKKGVDNSTQETPKSKENNDGGEQEGDLEKGYKDLEKMFSKDSLAKMSKEEKGKLKKQMQDTLKKMEDDGGEEEEDDNDEEKGVKKGINSDALEAAQTILKAAGYSVLSEEELENMQKSTEPVTLQKSVVNTDDEKKEFADTIIDLFKSEVSSILGESEEKINAQTTLIKSLGDELEELRDDVERIGSESPGRKSVTTKHHIEKSWENDLEKGIPGKEGKKNSLSISRNKTQILDMLEDTYFQKGELVDNQLAKDTQVYESAGQISKAIKDTIKEKGFELIP